MSSPDEIQGAYLKDSRLCPYCGSDNITRGTIQEEAGVRSGGTANRPVACMACNRGWYDCYRLVGFKPMRSKPFNEETS